MFVTSRKWGAIYDFTIFLLLLLCFFFFFFFFFSYSTTFKGYAINLFLHVFTHAKEERAHFSLLSFAKKSRLVCNSVMYDLIDGFSSLP
jgi:hypothetical protein